MHKCDMPVAGDTLPMLEHSLFVYKLAQPKHVSPEGAKQTLQVLVPRCLEVKLYAGAHPAVLNKYAQLGFASAQEKVYIVPVVLHDGVGKLYPVKP